jgi:hypothetical protein
MRSQSEVIATKPANRTGVDLTAHFLVAMSDLTSHPGAFAGRSGAITPNNCMIRTCSMVAKTRAATARRQVGIWSFARLHSPVTICQCVSGSVTTRGIRGTAANTTASESRPNVAERDM